MKKKHIYDQDGDFYPITHTQAVITPNGSTLEEKMQSSTNDVEGKLTGEGGANVYPFKHLGTFANVSLANNALDAAFVSSDAALQGHLRLIVNGQIMWCDQYALNYSLGHWLQVVFGVFKPSNDGSQLIYDYSKYHVVYRYRDGNNTPSWKDYSVDGLNLDTIVNLVVEALGGSGGGAPGVVDSSLDPTSTHAIQNKVVYDVLYNQTTGLATQISAIQTALTAGKIVMADGWGVLPSNPEEGMVAFMGGKIKTYTSGAWSDADPDETALYVAKASNVLYRWNGDVMESMVGQEVEDEWVLNSKKPVQSRTIAKRFKRLEIAMFGTEQGNSDETSITNDSLAKDMEDMKDAVFGEEQSGTRSGGLNNTVTDMKEALYGQGGTAQAPAQGSISQKVSTLETEAIKGIKVNGASIEKDQQGIANITVKATGSNYTAQVKSDWTGEDKRTSKLTNFEWSEDTDDAILVVDPNTKELWLGYCSDKDSDPRTYIYFQEWIDCGPIPSSDALAANGTTIQYTLGGISHTASYSTSTRKVTELIIGEGATLKAQTKSDWTGETKSDHKLTNFEWSEDADDVILVVDTTNNELWLGYSDMPDTPRTYVYYKEWNQCGSIPASDIIAEKGQLVQYVSDNVTYLAIYNATTHKVVPIGGSSDAIAQIDNSDKPVQSGVLRQEFDDIDGRIINLESIAGIVGSNNSFNRLSDKDEDFTEFDYTKGNLGCFTPKVSEEDIVVDDVDNIYTVKPPYEFSEEITDAKKPWLYDLNGTYILVGPKEQAEEATWVNLFGSLETYPHLWTDYELTKGSYICNIPNSYNAQTAVINTTESAKTIKDITIANSVAQGNENAFVLREIVKKESCIGFYINRTYNVVPQRFTRTSPTASIGGQSRAYFYFNLGSTNTNLIGRDTNNKYYRVKTTEYYSAEDGSLISKPTGAGTNSEKRAFSGGTPLSKTFDGNTFAIFEANNVQYFTRVISKYYDASGEVLPDADDILAISYKGKALVDGVERQQYLYRKDRYDQDGTWCYEKDGEFFNSSTHDKINKPNSDTPVTLDNTNTMYWPYTLAVSTNYSSDGLTYEERQQLMLSLPRDIIIVGENSGVATGGFITEGNFLYTAHSLVLYKVKFFTNQADGAVMIIADSYNKEDLKLLKGVDQVQVIGCEFDSAGYTYAAPDGTYTNESGQASVARKKSNYLMLHSQPNRKPFEGANNRTEKTQILVPDNYVNHLYIKGCTFHGGSCIIANDMRFVKSCRIIGNAFTEIMTVPVMISTQNVSGYSDNEVTIETKAGEYLGYDPISGIVSSTNYFEMTRPYMSCPIWIVGNEFSGRWQITKNRKGYNYFGGFLIEGACVYALHNVISNLISGVCYNSSLAYLPTYDAYCNCVQVYYANNTVKNIVRFRHPYKYIKETSITTDDTYNTSIDAGTIGIFKCKSTSTGLVRGGAANRKVLRHYKNNIYSVEPEKILALWKTWLATLENVMGENAVLNNEYAYDSQLIEYDESGNTNIENIVSGIHYFSIRFDAMNTQTAFGSQSAETDEIVISGNMFDAGKGALVGNDNGARWCTNSFSLEHNIFKAYWMSSDQWQSPLKGDVSDNPSFETIMSQNFFNLELRKRKGRQTTLNVIGNEIICPKLEVGEQCTVHLVQNMFTTQTGNQWYSDSHGDISNVTGNHYTNEGTNGGRILSRIRISADGGGVYDWYSGTTLTRIPNKISPTDYVDLRGKYTTLNDKQTSLETTLFGSNTDGISDIRQLNPQPGDKYIATVGGVNKVFTCQEAGETTQISILIHKLLSSPSSPKEVDIDLTKLVMPFTDSGGGDYLSLTSEQAQAIYTNIGNLSEATRTAYGLTLLSGSTVKVSYNRGAQYVLEQFLLANDYIKYGSGTVNKKEPGHFAVTAAVTTGSNTTDRYILIYPRYVGAIKESYTAKNGRTEVAELKKLLNYYYYNETYVYISYNRPNTGNYVGKVTIDGKDPLYDNGVVIVQEGMIDTLNTNLGTTDGKANLNRTIINNLLAALNTMRKAQDENAKDWVIGDDGSISEQQSS